MDKIEHVKNESEEKSTEKNNGPTLEQIDFWTLLKEQMGR